MTFRTLVFVALSAGLALFSRASLLRPGSHGFYRFFAWEAILGILLINIDRWFARPFSPVQLASWLLLALSAFLVVHSVQMLRTHGGKDLNRVDGTLIGLEKTSLLVTEGIYGLVRHPLYSSLLCLAWGACLKGPSVTTVFLASAATVLLWMTARSEEGENLRFFGSAYADYMARTKMFIPYIF